MVARVFSIPDDIELTDLHDVFLGFAQQRYAKSHRIFANVRCAKDFSLFRSSQGGCWFSQSGSSEKRGRESFLMLLSAARGAVA